MTLALCITLALLIIGFIIPTLSSLLGYKKSYQLNQTANELKTDITEHVNSLAELKIFDLENIHSNRIIQTSDNLLKQESKLSILTGLSSALMTLALGLTIIIVTMFAVNLTASGQINGAFIALIFLALMAMFETLMPLPLAYQYLGKTLSASKRILNITNSKPNVIYSEQAQELNKHSIKFDDISFGYNDSQNIFENFSLEIQDKEKSCSIFTNRSWQIYAD